MRMGRSTSDGTFTVIIEFNGPEKGQTKYPAAALDELLLIFDETKAALLTLQSEDAAIRAAQLPKES